MSDVGAATSHRATWLPLRCTATQISPGCCECAQGRYIQARRRNAPDFADPYIECFPTGRKRMAKTPKPRPGQRHGSSSTRYPAVRPISITSAHQPTRRVGWIPGSPDGLWIVSAGRPQSDGLNSVGDGVEVHWHPQREAQFRVEMPAAHRVHGRPIKLLETAGLVDAVACY